MRSWYRHDTAGRLEDQGGAVREVEGLVVDASRQACILVWVTEQPTIKVGWLLHDRDGGTWWAIQHVAIGGPDLAGRARVLVEPFEGSNRPDDVEQRERIIAVVPDGEEWIYGPPAARGVEALVV